MTMSDRVSSATAPDPGTERRWVASRIVFAVGVVFVAVLTVGLIVTTTIYMSLTGFVAAVLPVAEASPWWAYPLLAYLAYFVFPAIVFLPVLLPLALTWRTPRRIVIFRRFNTPDESRALRRIATRHLGRFGHVFTLADRRIHRSLFARIPALFGQLSLLHFRPRRIVSARRLTSLGRLLQRRWRLNLNWLVSFRKIFPIASSDQYWQPTVGLLLDEADLVVMDISSFSSSMSWELDECRRRGMLDRTVLLAERENVEQARSVVAQSLSDVNASPGSALFVHHRGDLDDPAALRVKIAEICASRGSRAQPSGLDMLVSAGGTLALSVALAAAGIAVTGPYVWPQQTARYSPIKSQVLTSYFVTRNPALLSNIISTDREWTLDRLRATLADDYRAHAAAVALRDLGDERDIPLLVQYLGNQPDQVDAEQPWWSRWFSADAISRQVEKESLVRLAQRLGKPAFAPLVRALATAPRLAFDFNLYDKYVRVQAADSPASMLEPLLTSPNQAGRFIAALELAPRGDIRTIPILLEIAHTPGANVSGAEELLGHFEGVHGVRGAWLDPYVLGSDSAGECAARLAIRAPDASYVAALVRRVPAGSGKRLLEQLVAAAQDSVEQLAGRAHALLAIAGDAWTRSLLTDPDEATRLDAAYARAERGDPAVLSLLLTSSKKRGQCESILFLKSDCNPYEGDALAAVDLLRVRLRPPQRLESSTADMNGLTGPMLTSLFRLVALSGDRDAAARLSQALHPDSRAEDRAALQDVAEHADVRTLRLLVQGVPRTAGAARASFLSAIAGGLEWRNAVDFCSIATAENRQDLVAAWKEAGQPCRARS